MPASPAETGSPIVTAIAGGPIAGGDDEDDSDDSDDSDNEDDADDADDSDEYGDIEWCDDDPSSAQPEPSSTGSYMAPVGHLDRDIIRNKIVTHSSRFFEQSCTSSGYPVVTPTPAGNISRIYPVRGLVSRCLEVAADEPTDGSQVTM